MSVRQRLLVFEHLLHSPFVDVEEQTRAVIEVALDLLSDLADYVTSSDIENLTKRIDDAHFPPELYPPVPPAIESVSKRRGIPRRLREAVIARDGFVCHYCRSSIDPGDGTIDHVVPVSKGGRNDLENLVHACARCNTSKGTHEQPRTFA